jgi:hypothetical protein
MLIFKAFYVCWCTSFYCQGVTFDILVKKGKRIENHNNFFLVLFKYTLFICTALVSLHSSLFTQIEIRPEVPSFPSHILPGSLLLSSSQVDGEGRVNLHCSQF